MYIFPSPYIATSDYLFCEGIRSVLCVTVPDKASVVLKHLACFVRVCTNSYADCMTMSMSMLGI